MQSPRNRWSAEGACLDPISDTYSGFDAPGCDQGLLTQHQNEMMLSAVGAFGARQPVSHLSSSYSEDDLAQAADVVTADLDAVLMGGHSTPPPAPLLAHGAQLAAQQRVYLKQEHSGAASSSCGASSPQASCDSQQAKAAQHQQMWAAQQQHHYDPCYGLSMEQYVAAPPMHGAFGLSCGGPCTGPCCAYPGASSLPPQGSGTMAGPAQYDSYAYYMQEPSPAAGGFGLGSAAGGPVGCAGMVPHAAFGSNGMSMNRNNSAPPAVVPSVNTQASLQPAYGTYPAIQGGVQKRQSGAASPGPKATSAAAEGRAACRSADGSCSSKGGSPAPLPRGNKAGSKGRAATAAGSGSSTGRGSRGTASAAAPAAAAVSASGSAASLIKELQQEIESLTSSKAQLRTQVKTLLTSQTDLLSRVATLTTKWQQAVAENAALHRQNLQFASQGL